MTRSEELEVYMRVANNAVHLLTKLGPLTQEGLHHLLKHKALKNGKWDEYEAAMTGIAFAQSKGMIIEPNFSKTQFYKLPDKKDELPRYPSHSNYEEAYYILYERYLAIKEASVFKDTPDEWLDIIFEPIIEKDKKY